ncbi:MAG: hypothetical protein E7J78_19580, partial [Pantoea sp.]|nr:hypothetical protein [Pantoea sp.]
NVVLRYVTDNHVFNLSLLLNGNTHVTLFSSRSLQSVASVLAVGGRHHRQSPPATSPGISSV